MRRNGQKTTFKTVTNSCRKQPQQDIKSCPVIPKLHILHGYCKNAQEIHLQLVHTNSFHVMCNYSIQGLKHATKNKHKSDKGIQICGRWINDNQSLCIHLSYKELMKCNDCHKNINCHITSKAKFLGCLKGSRALLLVQFGNNRVCWMRDNGAEHSRNVAGSKCYHKLLCLRTLATGLWYNISENRDFKFQTIKTAKL
jgi:hypothetical protein